MCRRRWHESGLPNLENLFSPCNLVTAQESKMLAIVQSYGYAGFGVASVEDW
jgi:hypothetical protein